MTTPPSGGPATGGPATGGAIGQLTRLLAMIPWLLQRPGVSVAETAAEFDISEEQLRADLGLAFFCGLPGHLPDDLIDVSLDGDTIVVANADTIARPLRFAPDEVVALVTALRVLADIPGPARPEAVDRVIAKLEGAAGDAADSHRKITIALEGADEHADPLRTALSEQRRVRLRYYVPARDEVTEREVDPLRLLVAGGRTYLEGWCLTADDVRIFRLDRIESLEVLDDATARRTLPPQRDLTQGVFDTTSAPWLVRLRLSARAHWVLDAFPVVVVSDTPDLIVDLPVGDLGWARRLVLQLGGDATPLDPPDLVTAVRDEAGRALAAYPPSG